MRLHFLATRFCFDNDTAFVAQLLRHLVRNCVGFGIKRRRDQTQTAHPHGNGAGIDRTKGGQVRTNQGQGLRIVSPSAGLLAMLEAPICATGAPPPLEVAIIPIASRKTFGLFPSIK